MNKIANGEMPKTSKAKPEIFDPLELKTFDNRRKANGSVDVASTPIGMSTTTSKNIKLRSRKASANQVDIFKTMESKKVCEPKY